MSTNFSFDCPVSGRESFYVALLVPSVALAPVFLLVLALGIQHWSRSRSGSAPSFSHMDVFTFNAALMDLLHITGITLICGGVFIDQSSFIQAGMGTIFFVSPGNALFHALACFERYLAVVHPVIHMHLRHRRAVLLRNAGAGGVWLLTSLIPLLTLVTSFDSVNATVLLLTAIASGFCSFSVLLVLLWPGPGSSKPRAIRTMVAITGALLGKFLSGGISSVLNNFAPRTEASCVVAWFYQWLCLPNSLVLPLLFLKKEGKLPGCSSKADGAE